jgi:hypothetical protein
MGIPTLISTSTASDSSSIDITSGIDSTYDEYMFVCTDIAPANDDVIFEFQFNVDGGSGYDEIIQSAGLRALHSENDSQAKVTFGGGAQRLSTEHQNFLPNIGNGADESAAGILHLFNPASATYVKHFYFTGSYTYAGDHQASDMTAGYINVTTAVTDIQFKMTSGNFDGVIQMYGIS